MRPKGEAVKQIRALYSLYDATETMSDFYERCGGVRGGKRGTLRTYRQIMLQFFQDVDVDPDSWIREVRAGKRSAENDFNKYIRKLGKQKDLSDNILHTIRAAFNKFARTMKLGELDIVPIGSSKLKRKIEPLEKGDVIKLVNVARTVRDRSLILFAQCSGARRGEIAQLRVKDFGEIFSRKEEPYAIRISDDIAKGGRGYVTFFTQEAADSIRTLIEASKMGPEDLVFPGSRQIDGILAHLKDRAGLQGDRVFHSLRKYTRTTLEFYIRSRDIVEKIIGHNSGSMEQIYEAPVIEQLRAEYAKALPEFWIFSKGNARIQEVEEDIERLRKENETLKKQMADHNTQLNELLEEIKSSVQNGRFKIRIGLSPEDRELINQAVKERLITTEGPYTMSELRAKLEGKTKAKEPKKKDQKPKK